MNEKEVDGEKLLLNEKKKDGRIGEGQEEVEKVIDVKGRGPLKVRTNTNPLLISYV